MAAPKKTSTKAASNSTAKKSAAKKAAPKKSAAKKAAPKKSAAKKAAPKKSAAQKAAPKKSAPQKAAPKKSAPQKTGLEKAVPQKAPPAKASAKKTPAKTPKQQTSTARGSDEPTTTIVQHVFLQGAPSDVFEMLTDAAKHAAFTGALASGDAVVGGEFTASNGYIFGHYTELQPDQLIVQEWSTTEWPKGQQASRLEIQLHGVTGGTELTMTHSDVPTSQAESYRQAWVDYYWTPLKQFFDRRGQPQADGVAVEA